MVRKTKVACEKRVSVSVAPSPEPPPPQPELVVDPVSPPDPPEAELCKPTAQSEAKTFCGYTLLNEICRDALSTTYACRREGLDNLLAIRIFNEKMRSDFRVRQILLAAHAAADVTHHNAVAVYDTGVGEDGSPYVVSDCIEGDSLAQVIAHSKRLDIARLLSIITQVGDALCEAHSRQLIHGNLSPSKIILAHNDDQLDLVKVIDFGMPADPVQNAFYLSPEQSLDKTRIDARCDIYSLGCILYECLVGTPPFVGHQRSQASLNILHELANQFGPDAPEHSALKLLDCIIVKCLQSDRKKRFGSVRELLDSLHLVMDCISGASNRKVPRKAEKLFLFRFLDQFDKKLVALAFIWLTVGLASAKFVSEIQLQKYIDEGQLAMFSGNTSLAQAAWNAAIHQAEVSHKPPSLVADLHWELGDTYMKESLDAGYAGAEGSQSALSKDAIEQFGQALSYFRGRSQFRSCEIGLLQNIAGLCLDMDQHNAGQARLLAARKQASTLLAGGDFNKCLTLCREVLRRHPDQEIAAIACDASAATMRKQPPTESLISRSRARYYCTEGQRSFAYNYDAEHQLKIDPNSSDTNSWIASKALECGDVEAASENRSIEPGVVSKMSILADQYLNLQLNAYCNIPEKTPALKNAISALEQSLTLQKAAYGAHSMKLLPAQFRLAECYFADGRIPEALETYRLALNAASSNTDAVSDDSALVYVNLLMDTGHAGKASSFLENRLLKYDRLFDTTNPLYLSLIQAYYKRGMKEDAHRLVTAINGGVEMRPAPSTPVVYRYSSTAPQSVADDPFIEQANSNPVVSGRGNVITIDQGSTSYTSTINGL